MQGKQGFAIQTLVVTLVLNGILLVVVSSVSGALATYGIGFVITLLLWFGVQAIGKRFIGGAAAVEAPAAPAPNASKATARPPKAPTASTAATTAAASTASCT